MIHHKNVLIIMNDHGSGVVLFFGDDYVFLPNNTTMKEIPVTTKYCRVFMTRSNLSSWRRFALSVWLFFRWVFMWAPRRELLKTLYLPRDVMNVNYLGSIPAESGALPEDVLIDSYGHTFRVIYPGGEVVNTKTDCEEFHIPNSLTFLYKSYDETTKP